MPTTIQQIRRTHRPARLFLHHFVDFAEVRTVARQLAETGEVREQYAVDRKPGQSVNNDRRFAHLACPCHHHFSDGFVRGFPHGSLRPAAFRCTGLKKCIPQKFSGRFGTLASSLIGMVEVFEASTGLRTNFVFRFGQHRFLTFGFSTTASTTAIHAVETAVFQHGLNGGDRACELQPVNFVRRSSCLFRGLAASVMLPASGISR